MRRDNSVICYFNEAGMLSEVFGQEFFEKREISMGHPYMMVSLVTTTS